MPSPTDAQFESYLRQFRPVEPPPLQAEMPARTRNWLLAAASFAAVVLIVVAFSLRSPNRNSAAAIANGSAAAEPLARPTPLTLRSANELLTTAPSFKAAIDKLSFQPPTALPSTNKSSALAVLSKEKLKL